tara:strand:- start:63341 stop:63802 length:462 start_codon:yes stop_codon:yes gene_type:complete
VCTSAHAEAPSKHKPTFGVGYKVGNGVGSIGADIIVSPIPHLSFELQASWLSDFDSGYAVLPSVVASLWDQGSTPYIKAGALYLSATLDDATGTGTGGFANIGYEWKLQSGLGIQLGGGVSYIQDRTVVSDNQIASIGGKVNPNLELGLRYRF